MMGQSVCVRNRQLLIGELLTAGGLRQFMRSNGGW